MIDPSSSANGGPPFRAICIFIAATRRTWTAADYEVPGGHTFGIAGELLEDAALQKQPPPGGAPHSRVERVRVAAMATQMDTIFCILPTHGTSGSYESGKGQPRGRGEGHSFSSHCKQSSSPSARLHSLQQPAISGGGAAVSNG